MSYKCALKLSIRWGLLGVLLGYVIIGIASMIIGRPIAFDRLIINLGNREIPYSRITPTSGWIAPLGLMLPVSAWMFMDFTREQFQIRRKRRGKNFFDIEAQTLPGYFFGFFGTILVAGAGIGASVFGSVVCMAIVMLFALTFYRDGGWSRYRDLSQVLYIPLLTSVAMWAGLTLFVGPIASLVYALTTMATAIMTFAIFVLPLAINSATKRQQKQARAAFRRTMLECSPKTPEKC